MTREETLRELMRCAWELRLADLQRAYKKAWYAREEADRAVDRASAELTKHIQERPQ